jgi:hypothetical protein
MKRLFLAMFLLLTCAAIFFAQQQNFPGGAGGGITSVGAFIDPKQAPYNAKFDARWTADGATTSGQPTVTSATVVFTQADVGKKIYTISSATGINRIIGTILSVQSATSVTASANASATESSSALVVCTDDTTALVSAWNAAIAANKLLQLPGGAACVSGPLFETIAPAGTQLGYSVLGAGINNTTLVMTPDFNFAGCTLGCIYGVTSNSFPFPSSLHIWPQVGEFSVTGMTSLFQGGQTGHDLFHSNAGAVYRNIEVNGVCGPSVTPIMVLSTEERAYNMNFQGLNCLGVEGSPTLIDVVGGSVEIYGPILAYTNGARAITFENTSVDGAVYGGLLVASGSNPGTNPHSSIALIGTNARLYGTVISPPVNANGIDVDPTSTLEIHGAKCNAQTTPTTCLNVQAGGVALVQDFTVNLSGGAIAVANAGTLFDLGGNRGWGTTSTGLAPTCVMTTGGGTGPACALVAGSTNEKGTIRMTPGTTPGNLGTTTLTFAGTFAGASNTTPSCTLTLANTGTGSWNTRGTTILLSRSTTAPVFNWDNNAITVTAASTYDVDYVCMAR